MAIGELLVQQLGHRDDTSRSAEDAAFEPLVGVPSGVKAFPPGAILAHAVGSGVESAEVGVGNHFMAMKEA